MTNTVSASTATTSPPEAIPHPVPRWVAGRVGRANCGPFVCDAASQNVGVAEKAHRVKAAVTREILRPSLSVGYRESLVAPLTCDNKEMHARLGEAIPGRFDLSGVCCGS